MQKTVLIVEDNELNISSSNDLGWEGHGLCPTLKGSER